MKKLFAYWAMALTMVCLACTNEDALSFDIEHMENQEKIAGSTVSKEDASNLIGMISSGLLNKEDVKTKSIESSIEQIRIDGIPVAYYMNYSDNKGFIVISASKIDKPVIAFSDSGSFVPSSESIQILLQEKKDLISSNNYISVDTTNVNYEFWKMLECGDDETVSIEIEEPLQYHEKSFSTKAWDERDNPLNRPMIFPLCYSASWGTGYGYNYYLNTTTNGSGIQVRAEASALSVALAHIMYAHWHPSRYGWMYMPSTIENKPENQKENHVGALIRDICNDLNVTYTSFLGKAVVYSRSMPNIPSMLHSKYEYTNGGSIIDYVSTEACFLNVYNSLKAGSPVLIYTHNIPDKYDAEVLGWVADGYQEVKIKVTKKKKVLGIVVKTTEYYYYTDYFHLLYSYNGENNGWYVYSDGNGNKSKVKKAVINIKP